MHLPREERLCFYKKIGLSDIEFRCEFLKLILVDNFLIGDTKELFFIKIKKHWSQQKFRNKTTEKKAYNFMMHKNIKEKLDKLSKKQNLPRNEIIEELINKAYKDLKEVK